MPHRRLEPIIGLPVAGTRETSAFNCLRSQGVRRMSFFYPTEDT